MKKQTVYNRLQQQYKKLNNRIQKAIKTGRFYSYTQFKQTQLLNRLKRCSFQLKQLGAGVAVVAALGMATPVVGQIPDFEQHLGSDKIMNFLENVGFQETADNQVVFVDLDGDGDQDCFGLEDAFIPPMTYQYPTLTYYENQGPLHAPVYQKQATSPLPTITDPYVPTFVDLDDDGDFDFFITKSNYGGPSNVVRYYENQGNATTPSFVELTGVNNPLDSLNKLFPTSVNPGQHGYLWFADLDGDDDLDFWYQNLVPLSSRQVRYCENIGSKTNPNFAVRATDILAFNNVNNIHNNTQVLQFWDGDKDGDLDVFTTRNISVTGMVYYENTGTATAPVFSTTPTPNTPLDSIPNHLRFNKFEFIDLDNDSDMDVVGINTPQGAGSYNYYFYENLDTTVVVSVNKLEENKNVFTIYPNPTSNTIQFEKPLTGQLSLFNVSGQLVFEKELFEEQEINVSTINNGIYFLEIRTDNGRIREKVLIQGK